MRENCLPLNRKLHGCSFILVVRKRFSGNVTSCLEWGCVFVCHIKVCLPLNRKLPGCSFILVVRKRFSGNVTSCFEWACVFVCHIEIRIQLKTVCKQDTWDDIGTWRRNNKGLEKLDSVNHYT
jgi:RNase P protein component